MELRSVTNNLFFFSEGNSLREDYKFVHTFDNEVAKFLKASPGQVVMLHPERFRSKYEPASNSLTVKVGHFDIFKEKMHNILYRFS